MWGLPYILRHSSTRRCAAKSCCKLKVMLFLALTRGIRANCGLTRGTVTCSQFSFCLPGVNPC